MKKHIAILTQLAPFRRHLEIYPSTMQRDRSAYTTCDRPWQDVHIDLCGPFPSGESLLVCEDACTRWPEVAILCSTTSAAIIGCLRKIFAVHGLLEKVVTDNGANLASEEFENFLEIQGIQHRKVSPTGPRRMQKLNVLTEPLKRQSTLHQLKAKTGEQTCLPSYLITVQHLMR